MMFTSAYYHTQDSPSDRDSYHSSNSFDPTTDTTVDPVLINHPIYFSSGQFAGQTIRYELKEIQKASLGRKYARVDRRPLDPPPVVLVRMFRYVPETRNEEEINYEDVQTHGLLCTVDLFPVPAKTSKDSPPPSVSANPRAPKTIQTNDGFVHFNPSGPPSMPSLTSSPSYRPQSYGPSDIVHYYEGVYALLESSKNTHCLVGATFVQPVLVEITGQKCIVFVFSDLAVKTEGCFTLRYRVFDLFSQGQDPRSLSQSPPPPTTYPTTPTSLSMSPSLSNITPSTPPLLGQAASSSAPHPSSSRAVQPQSYQQLQAQPPMNPYPDPSQGYIAPPPAPQQSRRRAPESDEIPSDFQAQFAPHESHPRIEPRDRGTSLSILAECWAKGAFRIYSTKEFPGLPASTELTKHLARWGVRLNIRETERRRRRRSMVDDEEEYHSDDDFGEVGYDSGPNNKDRQPLPQRKPKAKAKHKQQNRSRNQPQARFQSSPSVSPSQPPSQKRYSKQLDKKHHRGSSFDGEEYDGEYGGKMGGRGEGSSSHMAEFDEYESKLPSQLRPAPATTSGLSTSQLFTYSDTPASSMFDPQDLAHARGQQGSGQMGYTNPPQMHTAYAHSGMRSSIMGVDMFGPHDSHSSNAPSASGFSRHVGGRKRDSDGGSSNSGSVGSIGKSGAQGLAQPFVFSVGQGMDSVSGAQS